MFLSFTLQFVAVTLGVIISILTVDKLGAFSLPQPMPPVPRAPRAVQIVATQTHASPAPSARLHAPARPFVIPPRIPTGVPVIIDGPEMLPADASPLSGVGIAGIQGASPVSGVENSIPSSTTIPPKSTAPNAEIREEKQGLRIGGNVLEAKLVKRVVPAYPQLAKQMRISGVVRLEGVIARDGRVVNLQVVSGHPMLVAAAVEAVRQWIYRPTLLNGQSVEVIAPIDVRFILSQ